MNQKGIFVWGKIPNPPEELSAHQVYYKILNLIGSASKQNIKNLVDNFWAIHVGMLAKFQTSSFNEMGGGGDRRSDGQETSHHIASFPFALLARYNQFLTLRLQIFTSLLQQL